MSEQRITAAQLRSQAIGSLAEHERRQAAALEFLRLNGVPAVPVHTGPKVRPRKGGGFDLKRNTEQVGFFDITGCIPPLGRLLLVDIKTGKAHLSAAQRRVHELFTEAGAICVVMRELRDLERFMPIGRAQLQYHGGNP